MFCTHSLTHVIIFIRITLCGGFYLCAVLCTSAVSMPTPVILTPTPVFWTYTPAVLGSTNVDSAVASAVMAAMNSAIASKMDVYLVVGS